MKALLLLFAVSMLVLSNVAAQAAPKPHILMLLIDDFGWANIGFHRATPTREVQTPNMDRLASVGIELDRHYVFKFCSPTRSALQSGRNPIHVNVQNLDPTNYNANDPVSGFSGIPRNMTGVAEKLKSAGYKTHQVGKWDAGMATHDHTPQGRGYDTSLGYFHHANDYWTAITDSCDGNPIVDLWNTDQPAVNLTNPKTCSQEKQANCKYEDALFAEHVLQIIENHDPSTPLFLFWAPHNIHSPLEVPQEYVDKFSFIDKKPRQMYHAMVNYIDTRIGDVEAAFRKKGMWDDLLIVMSADNGGPIYTNGSAGANNFPLRGGKASNWEGGVRVNAFVSGGFVPASRRGTKEKNYICGWDWYATFSALAGVDPTDTRAAKAGLPPIDGVNQWPLLSGQNSTAPRTTVPLGHVAHIWTGATEINGIIHGDYKLLVGNIVEAGWTGPQYPNISTNWESFTTVANCGTGCLYDVTNDPTEHNDIAKDNPAIVEKLTAMMEDVRKTLFSPNRGPADPAACKAAVNKYHGYWGPFIE